MASLHFASNNGDEEIVKVLLSTVSGCRQDSLIYGTIIYVFLVLKLAGFFLIIWIQEFCSIVHLPFNCFLK